MTENSAFTKKHADVIARDERAILEEMNLPPAMISFIRKNEKNIKIAVALIVLLVIAWEGYGKYTSVQKEKSSAMLYSAVQNETPEQRSELLGQLVKEYSSSDSAEWAKVELGHIAFKDGNFDEAISSYKAALGNLSADSPMLPLVQYILAQSYENIDNYEAAGELFQQLSEITGFAGLGYLGLARINEKKGDNEQAATYYQEYVNLPEAQSATTTRDWVNAKINRLKNK